MAEINLRKTNDLNDVWSRGVRALLEICDKSGLVGHDNIADIDRLQVSTKFAGRPDTQSANQMSCFG
jgi:hypothetical protein